MRAYGVTEYGGPDALRLLDLPAQELGPGDVRMRVTAAGVNPTDTLVRSGLRTGLPTPPGGVAVPGMDIAGYVLEVGDEVGTAIGVGDRVMGIVVPSEAHGGYREDLVLPARSVTRIPPGLSDAEAATVPMNAMTAARALKLMGLRPGQVLAVTGAAGAFGGYLVELAKLEGLTVIADAAEKDRAVVQGLGADIVVERGDDVADRFRQHFPEGVDALADGALLNEAVLPAIRPGGIYGTVRLYQGDGRPGLRAMSIMVRESAEDTQMLDRLRDLVQERRLTVRLAGIYPAAEVADVHRRLEAGGTRGRLVLSFDEAIVPAAGDS